MLSLVRTTSLSKRWRDLWTSVPCLHFEAEDCRLDKFRNFVNRTLIVWKGRKIQKLTFHVKRHFSIRRSFFQDLNLWVCFALDHEVEELYLDLDGNEHSTRWMPQRLFSYSSIRKLSLLDCHLEVHRKIQWNQLKSLSIDNMNLSQFVIDEILLGSPQLEILRLSCYKNFSIYSSSLKRLSLLYCEEYLGHYDGIDVDPMLKVWSPNLEVLEISGNVYIKCSLMSIPSLVETTLNIDENWACIIHTDTDFLFDYILQGEMLREMFQSIHHIEKLSVGAWCVQVLAVMKKTDLPSPLLNLKSLMLDVGLEKAELAGILNLLEISPNVGMLSVQNRSYMLYKEDRIEWNWPLRNTSNHKQNSQILF